MPVPQRAVGRTRADSPGRAQTFRIAATTVGAFGRLLPSGWPIMAQHAQLLGYWTAETGHLNRIVHLWQYESLADRLTRRANLYTREDWHEQFIRQALPMLDAQENVLLRPLVWSGEPPGRPHNGAMLNLTGKVVLVTGGSRGIGAATVRTLASAGAQVIVHYGHSEREARAIVEALGEERAVALGADLSRPGVAVELFQEAAAWRGRVDVLVNNAGIAPSASVDDPPGEWSGAWAQTLQVNLVAVGDLCREAILHFRGRGGGIIVNVASRAAFRGDNPDAMHYAASKGGVIALTRSIARGYAAENILAYAVAPGWVRTEMAAGYLHDHAADIAREIPLGDVVPPEEVANTVAFLASGLARHMTGATLDLNGASYVR